MDTIKDEQDAQASTSLYSRRFGYVKLISSDENTITCRRIGGVFTWDKQGHLYGENVQDLYYIDKTGVQWDDDDAYNDWSTQTTTLREIQDGDIQSNKR